MQATDSLPVIAQVHL